MPGLTRLSRNRKLLLAAGVTVVVGALVVALAILRPWAPSQKEAADVAPPAAGDRVLQSVSLAMQSDGSLNQIGDTVVVSRGESGASDTYNTSYDPSKVVDELPVRIVSSYQTDHSSGTDLADLTGFTGRVTIDLAVQNLTVQPQQVSYDAGGRSHSTTAMVGAPLTVVASASLPGIDPATVVTAPKGGSSDADTTNGVLSRTADQGAQVQWATILAPPQLSATANLRLVIDAKDFVVPTVDLSVQPGLVTDPSVGALVDAAFNPKNSDELALESRTIGVIGDVNDVLTRASSQISKVRKTLDTTSKTLGTKTVLALQQDTKQIDTSLKQSDQNLDSLDKALQSSLKSTSSSTLESLASTVSQLDGLLGDTSAAPPEPTVSGSGCSSTVTPPKAGGSVYASLLQVTAQLEAYAKTTQDCKVELQQTILTTIGPAAPDDEACADDATSVTCSLNAVRSSFADITKDIEDAQTITTGLDPEKRFAASRDGVTSVSDQLTAIVKQTDALLDDDANAPEPALDRVSRALTSATAAVEAAQKSLADVTAGVGDIHTAALASKSKVESMVAQNNELAASLCQVIGDGTQPGTLTATQVEQFRSYLVTQSCPDANGATTPLTPPAKYGAAMSTRLADQADDWTDVADQTDTSDTKAGLGLLLTQAGDQLDDVASALETATTGLTDSDDAVTGLNTAAKKALADSQTVGSGLETLQKDYETSQSQLDVALKDAGEKAKGASTDNLDSAIAQVSQQGEASSEELGKAFESSAAGLSSAAKALQDAGAAAVDQQHRELDRTQQQASRSLSATTTAALRQVSGDVTSANRDLGTTRTQLTRDLNNVLLDLGNPRVQGSGVIGTVAKGATAAGSADYQLALAADRTSAYGAVREQDVAGIMLRQAQAEASLAAAGRPPGVLHGAARQCAAPHRLHVPSRRRPMSVGRSRA